MKRILQLVSLIAVLIVSAANPAFAQLSEVSVGPVQTVEIDRHGICKVVKNLNPTNALYVPSMSRDEWVNFLSVPPWREVSECAICSGYQRDGYCFYAGAISPVQTCNEVCSTRAGIHAGGMNRLIDKTISAALTFDQAPADSELFGGDVILTGGGGGPTGTYYCQKIIQAMLGHVSTSYTQAATGSSGYGCALINSKAGQVVYVDTSWNGAVRLPTPPAGKRNSPICACNR